MISQFQSPVVEEEFKVSVFASISKDTALPKLSAGRSVTITCVDASVRQDICVHYSSAILLLIIGKIFFLPVSSFHHVLYMH